MKVRWAGAGHFAHKRVMRNTKFWSEDLKGRDHKDPCVDERIILQWILGK